jgi:hypothetical protein
MAAVDLGFFSTLAVTYAIGLTQIHIHITPL